MAKGIKLRSWALDTADYETEGQFRDAVANELAAFEHIGERFGIALIATPVKQRVGEEFVTLGWTFHTATVPTVREVTATPDPEVTAALEEIEDDVAPVEGSPGESS